MAGTFDMFRRSQFLLPFLLHEILPNKDMSYKSVVPPWLLVLLTLPGLLVRINDVTRCVRRINRFLEKEKGN